MRPRGSACDDEHVKAGVRVGRYAETLSLASDITPRVRLSWFWLSVAAAVGSVLVGIHVYWESGGSHPWSGVFVNAGTALLLFVVLLIFQRSLVERTVSETIRRLTKEEVQKQWDEPTLNPITPGDFHEPTGPLAVAGAFVREIVAANYRDAITFGTPAWRLSRAQAWIFNNLEPLGLATEPKVVWDALAGHLAGGPHSDSPIWNEFVASEESLFREVMGEFDDDRWGWSQRRRIVGSRHEVVMALALPPDAPHGIIVDAPTLVTKSIRLLLKCVELDGALVYLIDGVNTDAPSSPGWPPSWWIVDDPAATRDHPGVQWRSGVGRETP